MGLKRTLSQTIGGITSTPLYPLMAAITLAYCGLVYGGGIFTERAVTLTYYVDVVAKIGFVCLLGFLAFSPYWILLKTPRTEPLRIIFTNWVTLVFDLRRYLPGLVLVALLTIFFSAFSSFKTLYPAIVPFYADPALDSFDRMLHFGKAPWEWLSPFFASDFAIIVADRIYHFWFFVKFSMLFWMGFTFYKPALRAQFFLTLILAWIINGSLLAMIFSSAGPCYFGAVYPGLTDPFVPLMDHIRAVDQTTPLHNIRYMDNLWNNMTGKGEGLFSGISAFPSMHVSVAVVYMLAALQMGWIARIFMTGFFILTLLFSVALGWHYAIDGYFSIITTWMIWVLCGYFVMKFRIWEPRPIHKTQDQDYASQTP
ncbi:MAG: phosphatase PAP2 family protein [Micavibrio sp.]